MLYLQRYLENNLQKLHIANLSFLLNYDTGETLDEIEYELYKAAWQRKESVHYDRAMGGSFTDLEQEPQNIGTIIKFTSNFITSVYMVNAEKSFNPYIIVGYSDISVQSNRNEYLVLVTYRLLKDLTVNGQITL